MTSLQFGPWAILYAAAALQGLFVAGVLLCTDRGNKQANKLLAVLVLAFSWTRFMSFVNLSELFRFWPHLISSGAVLWFLLAPLYYFYVRAFLAQPVQWNFFSVVHALPALAILIYMIPFYLLPAEAKLNLMLNPDPSERTRLVMLVFSLVYGAQNIVYLGMSIKSLRLASRAGAAAAKPAHLSWLRLLFTLMILFAVFHVIVASVEFWLNRDLVAMDYLPMTFFTVMVYAIAYLAMQQPEKLFPPHLRIKKMAWSGEPALAETDAVIRQLRKIMENEKPYLDCNLKYSDLAARLGISVRHLSRILNEELGQSFNDFVNAYRIKEVQSQLLHKQNGEHTLLAIALAAGFNSKTSFNRIFKSHTGMTPSQFLQARREPATAETSPVHSDSSAQ